ncbi:serine hydrolase [Polynucleobacter sp. MWH-Braz-FAM2G]|uniref:serine hydrolase domain-containing protein n=1 Tax=Polynucleobacter sp. MWH-Braz-FAM2G TaxID=1855883 RepID=UPI001BFD2447|nr:serine hydrolase domain-containing protein [Polynucleobacter sp. MWH-Braz-FAM2G]QWD90088.1 beta-lactamase family protein [Polynucleobacter sp. MWH-Braz-FAM2G]
MKFNPKLIVALLATHSILALAQADGTSKSQPVTKALQGYSNAEYQEMFKLFGYQNALIGGDVSLFANTHMSTLFHTAIISPSKPANPLPTELNPEVGKIQATTAYGQLSLDDFVTNPKSHIQAFLVMHKGKVVYERYPGMKSTDSHLWGSTAKPIVGLLLEQLIDEGKIDQNGTYGQYMPDFKGTAWENIKLLDIMNMASGLNVVESAASRHDPTSLPTRLFLSEFGQPDSITKKIESTRTILKLAKKEIEPGTRFDYSSVDTQALVLLIEEVTNKRLSDLANERIFSHMPLDGDMQLHLSGGDHVEAMHGLVSSRLRNLMMFGMQYTPSWNKISDKKVVSDAALHRIRKEVASHKAFMAGTNGPVFTEALNDYVISNNRQWDDIFPDGDMFKLGFMGQGLYVSPDRDLVIVYFSTSPDTGPGQRYMRPIAKSDLFNK